MGNWSRVISTYRGRTKFPAPTEFTHIRISAFKRHAQKRDSYRDATHSSLRGQVIRYVYVERMTERVYPTWFKDAEWLTSSSGWLKGGRSRIMIHDIASCLDGYMIIVIFHYFTYFSKHAGSKLMRVDTMRKNLPSFSYSYWFNSFLLAYENFRNYTSILNP